MTEPNNGHDWLEKLLYEYIKEMGLKDKLHLIQKLLKEIEKDISITKPISKGTSP